MSDDEAEQFYMDGYDDATNWIEPRRGNMFTEQACEYLRGYEDGVMERGWPDTSDNCIERRLR